jgi:hypothetical protein
MRSIILIFILLPFAFHAQKELSDKGLFSLGARTTFSFFDHHSGSMGTGAGGQFRIQLSERINTEWYLDYLSSQSNMVVGRKDLHIGWSVFYYYLKNNSTSKKLVQPFFEIGHCFDHTYVNEIGTNNFAERWSSAVQMGTGTSFNVTERFDLTAKVQYMIHLGGDIETVENSDHSHGLIEPHDHTAVTITQHKGVDLEGHLLCTISLNYKIGNLWKSEK